MRRFALAAVAALLAACLAAPALPAQAADGAGSPDRATAISTVRVLVAGLRIAAVTDDIAVSLEQIEADPDTYVLRAEAAGATGACSFTWTRTSDGAPDGFSWAGPECRLADHLELLERGRSYVYEVEARDGSGAVARASVRVIVADGYAERTLSAAGLTVTGSIHASAALEARVLAPDDPTRDALAEVAGEARVARAWHAELAGAPEGMPPFVGTLEVRALVPGAGEGAEVVVVRRDASGATSVSRAAAGGGSVTVLATGLGDVAVALPGGGGPVEPGPFVTVTVDVRGSAEAGSGGTVSPSGTFVVATGSSQTFYAYPDEGYDLDAVFVDGVEVEAFPVRAGGSPAARAEAFSAASRSVFLRVAAAPEAAPLAEREARPGGHGAYWFTVRDLREDTVVEVLFRRLGASEDPGSKPVATHVVRASAQGGGTVSPERAVVPDGGSASFALVPEAGFRLARLTLDGSDVTGRASGGCFTAEDVRADAELVASFAPVGGPDEGGGDGPQDGQGDDGGSGVDRQPASAAEGPRDPGGLGAAHTGDGAAARAFALAACVALASLLVALRAARAQRRERLRPALPKTEGRTSGRRIR